MILRLEISQGGVGARGVRAYLDGVLMERIDSIGEITGDTNIKRVSEYAFEIEGDFEVIRDERGLGTIKCK